MFGNFLYYIVVLLIYSTHQPTEEPNFSSLETLSFFVLLLASFYYFARIQFQRLLRLTPNETFVRTDHRFNATVNRLSVIAIVLFACYIYILNLTYFLSFVPIFSISPTFEALFFLFLFIAHLAVVYYTAYPAYRKIYRSDLTRSAYVTNSITISIPILLPWLLLSFAADIIQLLPFDLPKRLLDTTEGQIGFFLIFLFAVAVAGPYLIQKFWNCTPLAAGHMRSRIEAVCRRANMRYAEILYWPIFGGRMITAGVMGLVRRFRYILVTRALLEMLHPEEIDSVIAHEIGHVKRKHLVFYILFLVGYLVVSYTAFDLIIYGVIYTGPVYRLIAESGVHQTTIVSSLFSAMVILLFIVYFRYIFGFFMRNFERQADLYVFSLFNSAVPLISTLRKIAVTSGQPPEKPNWHHFSIQQRIDYLEKCETDKRWIVRHDRKVTRSIAVYCMVIVAVGFIGFQLNFGESGKRINNRFLIQVLQKELAKSPDSPELYGIMGDLYLDNENYGEAVAAYRRAVEFDPNDARVLNNLAWLLTTAKEPGFRDPETAVYLAEKAAMIQPLPHVLDTLAESYFATKQYEKAVSAEKRALEMNPKNRSYYEQQLDKFMEAIK